MHAVFCLLTSLLLSLLCQYVSGAPYLPCLLPVMSWCCFLSLSTCNIQEQKVSLLKSFVEMVRSSFLFLTAIFKPFQNSFSQYYCYIPIFYFKFHPKFPFLFHTPMFLMSSYCWNEELVVRAARSTDHQVLCNTLLR